MSLRSAYCVVTYGNRDNYQIPLALHEAGSLSAVITDFYSPNWIKKISTDQKNRWLLKLQARSHPQLSASYFRGNLAIKLAQASILRMRGIPAGERDRLLDDALAVRALRYALKNPTVPLLCYSYYWNRIGRALACGAICSPAYVFQVHPIASQIKQVIQADRQATGLTYSPEPEECYHDDISDSYLSSLNSASGIISASSFTAKGLHDKGISPGKTRVVPYGSGSDTSLACANFYNEPESRWINQSPLRLLWVGQMAYRKGAHYLLEAIRGFPPSQIQLTIATRSAIPGELAKLCTDNIKVLRNISNNKKQDLYNSHHLFTMPSLVEGFGLVYLEALASGLPIIATTNTGITDVITSGEEGFVIEPGSAEPIKMAIESCLSDSQLLATMSTKAKNLSNCLTWDRFRQGIVHSLSDFELSLHS